MAWIMRLVALLNAILVGYLAYEARNEAGPGPIADQALYLVVKLWPLVTAVFGFLAAGEMIKLLRDIRNQMSI